MSKARRFYRTRPLWRTLLDACIFAAALYFVVMVLEYFGVTALTPNHYVAVDGDSLRRGTFNVRLYGIDAPELHQSCQDGQANAYPCGQEAKDTLRHLVQGKTVECRAREHDKYGRTLAVCQVDGVELNHEMIRLGWAVAYDRHGFVYVLAERDARKHQRGIWYGSFENPSDYRARTRLTKSDVAGLASASESSVEPGIEPSDD
jgi:endonuclease YncB( thermonuclease family)